MLGGAPTTNRWLGCLVLVVAVGAMLVPAGSVRVIVVVAVLVVVIAVGPVLVLVVLDLFANLVHVELLRLRDELFERGGR
jgi:hypothetical protein